MRSQLPERVEIGRLTDGLMGSDRTYGPNGMFLIMGPCGSTLKIMASEGNDPIGCGWEHVSVSCKQRCPNWQEMSHVKNLFWDDDETVIQFHPPRAQYVNFHPNCLHLWKPPYAVLLPDPILIGPNT